MALHQNPAWSVIFYTILRIYFANTFKCDLEGNCICYQPTPFTYEFHCPIESPRLITRTNINEVEVECMTDINWEIQILPKLNMDHVSVLQVTMCPVPKQGLDEIMVKLGLNSTDSLRLSYSTNLFNMSLTQNTTRLSKLKVLDISNNELDQLDENYFVSLPELVSLDLSKNHIEKLHSTLFTTLINLNTLNLSSNVIKTFPQAVFVKNTKLEHLDLSDNPIELSSVPIKSLHGLKKLRLVNTLTENVPETFFENVPLLEHLDLSNNKITILSDLTFQPLTNLKSLNLEKNFLALISKGLLYYNRNLKQVNFGSNSISFINIHAFQRNTYLKEIVLANNKFKLTRNEMHLGVSPFQANVNLERLDLSHNKITDISDDWVLSKVHLKVLDLSHNEIKSLMLTDLMGVSSNLSIDLSNNEISSIDFRMANHLNPNTDNLFQRVVVLHENPIQCDCLMYDFARYFDGTINPLIPITIKIVADNLTCAGPNQLANKTMTEIKPKSLTCNVQNCPERCKCGFRAWDQALTIDCTHRNLTEAPVLPKEKKFVYNHTEVNLQGNILRKGPAEGMGYENVNKLNLAFNNISELTWIPPRLQVLNLTNNNIEHLDESLLYMLSGSSLLTNILLGNNPWKCGCSALNLRSFLITHLISKRMIDADNIKCRNDGRLVIHLSINDVCLTFSGLIVTCSLVLALVASAISVLTCMCAFSRRKKLYTSF